MIALRFKRADFVRERIADAPLAAKRTNGQTSKRPKSQTPQKPNAPKAKRQATKRLHRLGALQWK
jgi:hypothetical protein